MKVLFFLAIIALSLVAAQNTAVDSTSDETVDKETLQEMTLDIADIFKQNDSQGFDVDDFIVHLKPIVRHYHVPVIVKPIIRRRKGDRIIIVRQVNRDGKTVEEYDEEDENIVDADSDSESCSSDDEATSADNNLHYNTGNYYTKPTAPPKKAARIVYVTETVSNSETYKEYLVNPEDYEDSEEFDALVAPVAPRLKTPLSSTSHARQATAGYVTIRPQLSRPAIIVKYAVEDSLVEDIIKEIEKEDAEDLMSSKIANRPNSPMLSTNPNAPKFRGSLNSPKIRRDE